MFIHRLIRDVANLAYPPRCAVCGEAGMEDQPLLCQGCSDELDKLAAAAMCPRCARPVGSAGGDCPHCKGRGFFPFDRIVALGPFRDPLKKLIHGAKYHHRWTLAEMLADRLLNQERAKGLLTETQLVIAVPLHWSRQIGRGYNQAQLIARRLAKKCGIPQRRSLVRVKNTDAQTLTRSRAERANNLRHAFGLIDPRGVQGRHIVLVDDVMTTAATLKSAATALRQAGPASVSAIVLAVADPRGRDFQAI